MRYIPNAERLFSELCVELGFCLPLAEQQRLKRNPPESIDGFTNAIFTAEGLDPQLSSKQLWRQVRDRVAVYFDPANLAHAHSADHADEIKSSALCGCFYCARIFSPAEILDWVNDGATARCPYCGIDSVIGSNSGFPISPSLLLQMCELWFRSTAVSRPSTRH